MVGNRVWSRGRNSRQKSALKWRPLKGGISISNQRWGGCERERGSERVWREWRERDKKRNIHSRLTNQRERKEGAFKRVQGPKRKSERKTGMKGGGPQTGKYEGREGNNVHLWTGWKSGRQRYGLSGGLISTVHPFVFHLRLRQRAVLHRASLSPLPSPN